MPELLLELFSEEIPARMQQQAASDLARLITKSLADAGLAHGKTTTYATPRRLTLVLDDVAEGSEPVVEERKGPRVGAPEKAVAGFLRGAGLASIDDATIVNDPKKGDFYVARTEKPGRAAADIIAEATIETVKKFPWPKSMEWGNGGLKWVRPLERIICLLDGAVVPFEVAGIQSGAETGGHRFMGKAKISVTDHATYAAKLKAQKVIIDSAERMAIIRDQARASAADAGLEWIEDEVLVAENAGLTEWPTVLMGTFDADFLSVPPEVLTTSMKSHQKCFSLRDPKTGDLANRFLLVTNLLAADGGTKIIEGNERVIAARLSDAKFFWEKDLTTKLDGMAAGLPAITFHEKLGTQAERVARMTELAKETARSIDAEPEHAGRAAQLAKADLVSEMVGEFPELQGLMGRYYATAEGLEPRVATAIEQHYWPKGAGADIPSDSVAIAVALADKLHTLVGFWAIDEKPTGSGDPYALRRAALGIIRICVENDLRIKLKECAARHIERLGKRNDEGELWIWGDAPSDKRSRPDDGLVMSPQTLVDNAPGKIDDLLSFFADRLKVYLRDRGQRHDLIDAIFALDGQDDLALIVRRVEALSDFLATDDGANLLAGVKRAQNILAIEEKKDGTTFDGTVDTAKLDAAEEKALNDVIGEVAKAVTKALAGEDFAGAMRALADLRAPVDAFFDAVIVNADDAALRTNRLHLLAAIRNVASTVADFSKIAG
ncbi:MAG: glycine--tRNA ligase subunit beta [Pseudomonadota bacterium]